MVLKHFPSRERKSTEKPYGKENVSRFSHTEGC